MKKDDFWHTPSQTARRFGAVCDTINIRKDAEIRARAEEEEEEEEEAARQAERARLQAQEVLEGLQSKQDMRLCKKCGEMRASPCE